MYKIDTKVPTVLQIYKYNMSRNDILDNKSNSYINIFFTNNGTSEAFNSDSDNTA